MKQQDPRQRSFAVILGSHAGAERYRSTIFASNRQEAAMEAAAMAERRNLTVELVEPTRDPPGWQVTQAAAEQGLDRTG